MPPLMDNVEVLGPTPVTLHIYNVGTSNEVQAINKVLRVLGTGAFHCGVEVYGTEWSYRATSFRIPGVFSRRPRDCEGHIYSESVPMGMTMMSFRHVHEAIRVLSEDWLGTKYDLLKRNCCHFCDVFCHVLGVGTIPAWITSLASTGAAIIETRDYIGRRTISISDKMESLCGVPTPMPSSPTAAYTCTGCLCTPAAAPRCMVESY